MVFVEVYAFEKFSLSPPRVAANMILLRLGPENRESL